MRRTSGLSLVEVVVALGVVALAIGPLITMLSSSNRASNASVYEVMAVHYANELAEQLQRLGPHLTDIISDARLRTGDSLFTLDDLLMDPLFQSELRAHFDNPKAVRFQANGMPMNVSLMVSPLHKHFTDRRLEVTRLDHSGTTVLTGGAFYDVRIVLTWRLQPSDPPDRHQAVFSVLLRE